MPQRQGGRDGRTQKASTEGGAEEMTERFAVGSSPHIHAPLDTQKIMAWVQTLCAIL